MKYYIITSILTGLLSLNSYSNAQTEIKNEKQTMKVEITDTRIDVISDIIYSQITSASSNRQLKMTLLIPQTKGPKPAIVYYPGGGFTTAVHDKYIQMRMALAKAGFVVAAVEYRTVPDVYPALINDAKSAVRYLRAHAKQFNIDPNRIGVIGDSAGGYVSQMMGTTNGEDEFDVGDYTDFASDVQAAVTIYGISNLMNIGEGYSDAIQKVHESPAVTEALLLYGPAFAEFAGKDILSDPQKAMNASPLGHVKADMFLFLLMHGSADKLVSPVQSEQLYNALIKKGNNVDYIVVEGAGHGDLYWYQPTIINKVVSWFKENLMDKGAESTSTKVESELKDNL